jgi:hypothetical protein
MDENDKNKPETKDKVVVSFRAPRIVRKQLQELAERWGENTTHVIHRAVAIAYEREFGKKRS